MTAHTRTLLAQLHHLTAPATSDATLLTRWTQQRDHTAFAALMARHGPMVLGVCRRLLGEEQEAEDVFQATFLVLSQQAARLRQPEALASFLHTVAVRLARKAGAARRRRQQMQRTAEAPEPIDSRPHPLDVLSGRELLALLDAEIARLPEAYRLPLLLCLLQGQTVEEAAQLLGWSIGSVRGRLARGREQLRRRLTRRGLDLSVGTVALLAPVVVPERLLAESLRHVGGVVPPALSALAGSAISGLRLKFVCLSLFLLTAVGLGIGLPLLQAPTPSPETPAATAPPAPATQAKDEPRRDRYGDPLPPGAVARLGTLRFRVPEEIKTLAFAPDGKTIAVSSPAGLFLFDAASGKRIKRLLAPDSRRDWEHFLVFSPDSKRLAGMGRTTTAENRFREVVFVWELAGQRKPREYDAENAVWVGWSAEGEPLAVYRETGALRLHELAAGRSRRFECKEPSGVACAPAARTLVAVEGQGVVRVWDTATGRERCTFRAKDASTRPLILSPDGRILAFRGGENVQLWDATTGKALQTVATDQKFLESAVFAPDGKTLATAGWSGVRFWDVATGRERNRIEGAGADTARAVAFAPDGQTLATGERHGRAIHLWDVATGKQKPQPIGHCAHANATFSPDGRRVATGGSLDGSIYIWDLATSKPLTHIQRPRWVRDCAFSPDGRLLFSTGSDEELWVCDAANGERREVLKLEDPERPDTYQSAFSMYRSGDGKTLVALSFYYPRKNNGGPSQESLITSWDTSTRKQLFRRRRPGRALWIALSADARVLAAQDSRSERGTGPGQGPMRLEDVATGEQLLTFPALEGTTWPMAFSPDGRLLASNNFNWKRKDKKDDPASATGHALHLWETATAAEILTLPLENSSRAAFSPDGRLLAMTAPSQEILVYDLARGREWRRFSRFGTQVGSLVFSPDGRRLVSGLNDSTLLVWDVGAPEPLPVRALGAEGLAKRWADLASEDAPRAFRARWELVSAPEEAIPFLKKHLRPIRPADPEWLRRLLADLESEQFAVREKAQEELQLLGDLAEPALRRILEGKPTLEVRRRVQTVLERLHGPVTRPKLRQALRAVAVLEDIGTPAARQLLEELAKGAREARLTREAKTALHRLDWRGPSGR